jgi:lysophospholipase L1-like esterase
MFRKFPFRCLWWLRALVCLLSWRGLPAPASAPAWVGSWAASQQIPEAENALPSDDLRHATLRQIVHLSTGGSTIRVHVSNAFGTAPLHLVSVHIARTLSATASTLAPNTDRALTFHGHSDVIISPGAEFISDPIDFPAPALSDLAISIYYDEPPAQQTGHPGSRATSYLAPGNLVSALDLTRAKKFDHWYQISAVDVQTDRPSAAVVALGDSITDGHGATTNANDRWPDVLARRLQHDQALQALGVLNQGIGGNHVLESGLGPNALARFDRDVLAQTGVRYLIILEGVNDLGAISRAGDTNPAHHAALVERITAAYEQMITRAHAHSIQVFGATILPYTGSDYYHSGPAERADREAVNAWIRAPGHFDAVIDFDRVIADPARPERLLPKYDCGDHLHPSPAGYAAMGQSIRLSLFDSVRSMKMRTRER